MDDPEMLEERLEQIFDLDQNAIKDFKRGTVTLDAFKKTNQDNLEFVRGLSTEGVFPYRDTFSEKAYKAFFLVVQHSGDLALMRQVADIISRADSTKVEKKDFAYLTDRIWLLEGKTQLYGTQFQKEGGVVTFFDIEDFPNINARRAALGMESFDEYKKKVANY